jgi:rod shape determining protein RodA
MQLLWVVLGVVVLLATMSFDYARLPNVHLPIYVGTLALLVLVLLLPERRGTHRWIEFGPVSLQPAEFAQIALLITLACAANAREHLADFFAVSKVLLWVVPSIGLIMLGVWFGMMFLGGARLPNLAGYAVALICLFAAAWFGGLIHDYQKARLLTFLHPWDDPMGEGFQLTQSLTAIGHGGFLGQGLFRGTLTGLGRIPDQETDFIFTSVAEELGFVGALTVLGLFTVILWRGTAAALEAKDTLGRLLAGGATAVIGIHVLANIAMTMGLAPVKGMPLPLLSYGGSSMLSTMLAVGLLQNVYMRRHKITF